MVDASNATKNWRTTDPPTDLPRDADRFWTAPANLDAIDLPPDADSIPALRRLGPLPFPRGRFPLMGFLATVYDHVADRASEVLSSDSRHVS